MIKAILYTSNSGYTAKYASLLSELTGLSCYPLKNAPVPKGEEIIYMGWLMASGIKGYKKARAKYSIAAACGVGMGPTGSQISELRDRNHIPKGLPLFTLQGGFDLNKLTGIYKLMMGTMKNTVGKALEAKPDRTAEENDMLDMMLHGGDRVSAENLAELIGWYEGKKED